MKTVIITGSSSGIGRETVKYFSAQGWQVAATLRRPEEETALQTYPNVRLFQLDVTDQDSVTHAFTSIKATYNKIDVLINNAGYAVLGVLEAATIEDVQQQFDTNLFGVFRTIKAVLPVFRQQKTGTILNVSSLGGRMTFPLYSLYHSTKWALEGFSESLSYELEPLGIRVKIIEPGAVKTNFNGRSMVSLNSDHLPDYAPYQEKILRSYNQSLQQGYGAEPIEIAEAIFEAATDDSNLLRYPCPKGGQVDVMLKMRHEMPVESFQDTIKAMFGG